MQINGARRTYDIIEPQILRILQPLFIPLMSQNNLNLIFFLVLRIRIDIVSRTRLIRIEFFKVSNVVDVVGDFDSA
jgi:hypothetical protein